ncbi:aspartate aminotransferase family protein [Ilumatobacter sp.]|uniref:aminotransferase family protein n=1 Tax=Ilumatobacter sp. TaxID=1967498 RepID=UPI003B51A453
MGAFLHSFAPPSKGESDFIEIVSASGSTLTVRDGSTYLDAMAGLWYCQVGFGRADLVDAITAQLRDLAVYHTFDPFTNAVAAEAAELIASRSPHPDGRVFLACSGSEAVDTALKLSRLVQRRRGRPDKQIVVRRSHGYHGTNFGGTSAQGIAANREGWGDLLDHFVEVPHDDLEALAAVFAEHGDRIAAVITEPVQGAGGVHPPTEGYLEALRRSCDRHGSLLVFDEVICGFGRTGEWFGAQTFGVRPDLMCFAKGVTSGYQPLSGVIVSSDVGAELADPAGEVLRTGYTYSGHPAACAAAIANIGIIEAEGLRERAVAIGERLESGFEALRRDGAIRGSRGVGAIRAVELFEDSAPARAALLDRGVVTRPVGTALAFCPPLVMTDDELDRILDTLSEVLAERPGRS